MLARFLRRLSALSTVAALAVTLALGVAPASAAEPVPRAVAALDWLAGELAANDGMLTVTFGTDAFPDPGLTIDAILASVAGGQGDDPAVIEAVAAVDAATFDYVNQLSAFPADRAANATAKALLLQQVLGTDLSDTVDLEVDLRSLMATTGDEIGRFNDTDLQGFGNYANGLGQALAVLALDRTTGGVPSEAVDFLLDQQCADGSFRLYYFGYVTSFDPFETVSDLTCTDPADGDVDATALALDALLAGPASPVVTDAIAAAASFLRLAQDGAGGFTGTGAVNANTTGLAGAALRAVGETAGADAAAGFVASLQQVACADFGAVAYDGASFAEGVDGDRDQWIRATAQGVLGLGLPSYGTIGAADPATAGLDPVACPTPPVAGPPPTDGAAAAPGGPTTLPVTGRHTGEASVVALSLMAVGAGLVTISRRRPVGGR